MCLRMMHVVQVLIGTPCSQLQEGLRLHVHGGKGLFVRVSYVTGMCGCPFLVKVGTTASIGSCPSIYYGEASTVLYDMNLQGQLYVLHFLMSQRRIADCLLQYSKSGGIRTVRVVRMR